VQTGPTAGDSGRVHHRRHRMRMSAADTVVCKDGSNTANAATVTLADGRKVFAGSSGTPGAPAK